jgi:hypothetical protein
LERVPVQRLALTDARRAGPYVGQWRDRSGSGWLTTVHLTVKRAR